MNLSGYLTSVVSPHTIADNKLIAVLIAMFVFAIGIRWSFGPLASTTGAGMAFESKQGERHGCDGSVTIAGVAPGVFARVVRRCVRGAAWSVRGAVGFVVVVMGGSCTTL